MADNGEKKLLRQRGQLADFGLLAVEGADLDELLQEAAAEAARSLDVSYVKVLEYLPEEKRLSVRAGVGWGEGVVGEGVHRRRHRVARGLRASDGPAGDCQRSG